MLQTLALLAGLTAPQTEAPAQKILPELREAFVETPAEEKFRVYAVLAERMTYADFRGTVESMRRGERQRYVADTLRAFADARQGRVLSLLSELEAAGQVERVRQLWITNSVIFQGTRAAVEAVAGLAEVERIGWDPERPQEHYWDVAPAGEFTTYYSESFASGILPPNITTTTSGCGFVSSTSSFGPKGVFHMVLGSTQDSCDSTATATVSIDLTGVTTAKLRFDFKDMSDEFDPGEDILEASDDGGASWVAVADLTGSDGSYITQTYELDPLGLTYGPDFLLRFSWADNFTPETDGFGIDNIQLADDFAPPPPPEPQPNLVQLQAPALWDLGYTGQGAVILNIDSGVDDSHPDLAGRIWTNPLDPVDGIDNDGNGYTDDVKGWDFSSGDNDPDPAGATHGTNTAGIMVGDGASGINLTGMAPGALMATARINGETDHWEAQQWGISVGVDCSSSSHSYKIWFNPFPDYHMHRMVEDMVLAAGIIHANSIGNDGGFSGAPIPFNISAPGLSPAPWRHFAQSQDDGGVSGVLACGGIELNDTHYSFSGEGPSAWEDMTTYEGTYTHTQKPEYWDYPVGGYGGTGQGLVKPDLVTYTNVVTTSNGGSYNSSFGGTSAATPHLGGSLALMISAQPEAAPRHVAQALQLAAEDMGEAGKDNVFGAGKVQVLDAAKRLFHLVRADQLEPSIGSTVTIDLYGFPGDGFRAFYSIGGYGSTPVGAIGALDIAPPVTALVTAVLDGDGRYTLEFDVPNNPALIGLDVFLQSIENNVTGLTGEFLFSVVEQVTVQP